jgi:hypothetical protein
MGRASRSKWERRLANSKGSAEGNRSQEAWRTAFENASPFEKFKAKLGEERRRGGAPSIECKRPDGPVYRRPGEGWAHPFVNGCVRLGSLESFRNQEDPAKIDAREGEQTYRSGAISGLSSDPEVAHRMQHSGIAVFGGGVASISMSGNTTTWHIPNAFVLCMSTVRDSDVTQQRYGEECVRIFDVEGLFRAITATLVASGYSIRSARADVVTYTERDFQGNEASPGLLAFVKPKRYEVEQEYRFVWVVDGLGPETPHLDITVNDCARYCEVIGVL